MPAAVGQPAPDFKLRNTANEEVSLGDLKGKKSLIVFIPHPFTGICESEVCAIRDDYSSLEGLDANVVVITNYPRPALNEWKTKLGLQFPVLSDFWPHGDVARAFGSFNENMGVSMRWSFVLDEDGVVREIIKTDTLPEPREYDAYKRALSAI